MAKIGLDNFLYAVIGSNGEYGTIKKPAKAINCSVSITSSDVKLYADDALAESDTSFQSGTVSMGIDDEDLEVMADLLGHTYTSGEIVRNANDIAPYVGFGRIITKLVNGTKSYKAEVLTRVKFSEPSQEDTTKGETIAFGTSTIEGVITTDANGKWSAGKQFTTHAEAETYIRGQLAGAGGSV